MLLTFIDQLVYYKGARDDAVGSGVALQAGRSRVRSTYSYRPRHGPGIYSASYRDWYQEMYLLFIIEGSRNISCSVKEADA